MLSEPDYIIVQAGGLGSRLKKYTANKPKAIVSVNNLPILFHLFKKYPNKKYIIIGDYKKEVLDNYLDTFCTSKFITVCTDGNKGTCSGMKNALKIIPPETKFAIIWSDLILGEKFKMPSDDNNYIGISGTFSCRWSFRDDLFVEERSDENGVAGLFIFKEKKIIENVPDSGEFVKWLQNQKIPFKRLNLSETAEYGLLETIKGPESGKCRPFNSMKIVDGKIIKEGIDEQGKKLAVREKQWYKYVSSLNIQIPKIYSFEPLTMEKIDGKNVFDYPEMNSEEKKAVLKSIMDSLSSMHNYNLTFPDRYSMKKAYFTKTFDRLSKIQNLIPFAHDEYITINNKKCKNVFYHINEIRDRISKIKCDNFSLIHGDCTFSNIILKNKRDPIFIDPRGYFGNCEIIGDPNYDWAKLYYSVFGDYDQFNLGRFDLSINEKDVNLNIATNGWKCVEDSFIENLPKEIKIDDIRFIHALIWLSLTTYAWDDYDSICGAFYNGLYYLEDTI